MSLDSDGSHDYTSFAGQQHLHGNCICSIPYFVKYMDNLNEAVDGTSWLDPNGNVLLNRSLAEDATSIVVRLKQFAHVDVITQIINNHGSKFKPELLDFDQWSD